MRSRLAGLALVLLVLQLTLVGCTARAFSVDQGAQVVIDRELQEYDKSLAEIRPEIEKLISLFEPVLEGTDSRDPEALEQLADLLEQNWDRSGGSYQSTKGQVLHHYVDMTLLKLRVGYIHVGGALEFPDQRDYHEYAALQYLKEATELWSKAQARRSSAL